VSAGLASRLKEAGWPGHWNVRFAPEADIPGGHVPSTGMKANRAAGSSMPRGLLLPPD